MHAAWNSKVDPATKKSYYYNHVTGETTWERPAAMGSTRQRDLTDALEMRTALLAVRDGGDELHEVEAEILNLQAKLGLEVGLPAAPAALVAPATPTGPTAAQRTQWEQNLTDALDLRDALVSTGDTSGELQEVEAEIRELQAKLK